MIRVSLICDGVGHGVQLYDVAPSGSGRNVGAAHFAAQTDADAKGWRYFRHGRHPAQWLCPRCIT